MKKNAEDVVEMIDDLIVDMMMVAALVLAVAVLVLALVLEVAVLVLEVAVLAGHHGAALVHVLLQVLKFLWQI